MKAFKYKTTDTIREQYFIDEDQKSEIDISSTEELSLDTGRSDRNENLNQPKPSPIEQIWCG